jgi:hypothetical protein
MACNLDQSLAADLLIVFKKVNMKPWYKNATPRDEVREGRAFNPDEVAIALEQVAACKSPDDYRDPNKFFSRTCFTRALTDHIVNAFAQSSAS